MLHVCFSSKVKIVIGQLCSLCLGFGTAGNHHIPRISTLQIPKLKNSTHLIRKTQTLLRIGD